MNICPRYIDSAAKFRILSVLTTDWSAATFFASVHSEIGVYPEYGHKNLADNVGYLATDLNFDAITEFSCILDQLSL